MRRTPLKRKSAMPKTKRKAARKDATEQIKDYRDGHGLAFDDVRFVLGEDRALWPKFGEPVRDPRVAEWMHLTFSACWACGAEDLPGQQVVEMDHVAAGFTRFKSDELTNAAMLCNDFGNGCHGKKGTNALPMGRIFYLMWRENKPCVDWVRLTILWGRFLPDLIPD